MARRADGATRSLGREAMEQIHLLRDQMFPAGTRRDLFLKRLRSTFE